MDFITSVIVPVIILAVLYMGFQVFMTRRMRKLKGQAAPEVDGSAGRHLADGGSALFYSPQCGACRTMTPVVKDLASKASGVFPVDITQDMDTARRFGVLATPTTIVVRDGTVAEVLVGPQSPERLQGLAGA